MLYFIKVQESKKYIPRSKRYFPGVSGTSVESFVRKGFRNVNNLRGCDEDDGDPECTEDPEEDDDDDPECTEDPEEEDELEREQGASFVSATFDGDLNGPSSVCSFLSSSLFVCKL